MALVVPRFSRSTRRLGQGALLAVAVVVTLSVPAHLNPEER